MLQRIRGVLDIRQEIDKLKQSWEEHTQQTVEFKKNLAAVEQKIEEMTSSQEEIATAQLELLDQFRKNLGAMDQVRDKFRQQLDNFSVMKKDLQQEVHRKFEQELTAELVKHSEELQVQGDEYGRIKDDIKAVAAQLTALQAEVTKFLAISEHIKGKDFEMTTMAQELLAMDKHKLELMRKIDTLERLVARLRRK